MSLDHRPAHHPVTTVPRSAAIVVVGAGTAGLTVAARLRRAGARDVVVVDPADTHWYQPLWTLVGGGRAPVEASRRPMRDVVPAGVRWVQDSVVRVDPHERRVHLAGGPSITYGQLVMAPGLQLDWDAVPGLAGTVGEHGTSSNYRPDLAQRTWDLVRSTRAGTAVFTMPSTPIKCGGAPQKIAYLAADFWRSQGVLDDIDVHLVLGTETMFKVPQFSAILERTARDYGITVHLASEVVAVDGPSRTLQVRDRAGVVRPMPYTMAHLVPPQSAPDWVKASPLADPASPQGYVEVDRHTLQHPRYPEVFALGDVAATPASKTGAAVRKQAPVVVANMRSAWRGEPLTARYDGYSSCPLTLSRRRLLLAEFDYDHTPTPSNPLPWPDTTRPITDHNLVKRVGLPAMYWHLMLKGLV